MVGWHHRLDGDEFEPTPGRQRRTCMPGVYAAVAGVAKSQTQLSA